jgi:L-glyceraldehyde 3-phosphate reductase
MSYTKTYTPSPTRYQNPQGWFRRCGRSGLLLPAISLGLWHNFGLEADDNNARDMIFTAFDNGITHFDLANNYGPPPGSAETRFSSIVKQLPRDETIIATKAGWGMWPGPYGDFGSRKYLIASIDQSLKRMGLDYVDIFYHHRPDPGATPLEETMAALDQIVRSGKALYAGISSYSGLLTHNASTVCRENRLSPILINQVNYNILERWIERELVGAAGNLGIGLMCFCPLAQGRLTDRYLNGIPEDSRAKSKSNFLTEKQIDETLRGKVTRLNKIAQARGQSLAQMSLAWVLRDPAVTSALIGASRPEQILDNIKAVNNISFSDEELKAIDAAVA